MAGSVGLELAAGRDSEVVQGEEEMGYFKVKNWVPCPYIPGRSAILVNRPPYIVRQTFTFANHPDRKVSSLQVAQPHSRSSKLQTTDSCVSPALIDPRCWGRAHACSHT